MRPRTRSFRFDMCNNPRWIAVFALVALIGAHGEARAKRERGALASSESPDDKTLAQAEQALKAARAALAAQDLGLAYRHADASFRLVHSPEALFLLGRVALAENRPLDAQDLMRRYLADPNLESAPDSPEQKEAQRIADQPRPQSAKLNILGNRGTLVFIDGRLVGALPLSRPLLLSVDEHKVELLRGNRHIEDQVRVPVGRLGEVRSDLTTRTLLLSVLPGVVLLDEYRGLKSAEQRRIEQTVEEAVHAERLSPLSRDLVFDVFGEPAPSSCPEEHRCLRELTERCEADYVLRVFSEQKTADWQLAMELLDVTLGEAALREETSCANCTAEQAAQKLAGLFGPLYRKLSNKPRGRLELRSSPDEAEVLLDGRRAGTTPYRATLFTGNRELVLRKNDYTEERRELVIRDGKTAELSVELQPVPEPVPRELLPVPVQVPVPQFVWRREPRPLYRLAAGAATIAAGALLIGFGASALAFDEQCVGGAPVTTTSLCLKIYDTRTPGQGLTVAGGLLVGAGVVLLAWPGPKRKVQVAQSGLKLHFGPALSGMAFY